MNMDTENDHLFQKVSDPTQMWEVKKVQKLDNLIEEFEQQHQPSQATTRVEYFTLLSKHAGIQRFITDELVRSKADERSSSHQRSRSSSEDLVQQLAASLMIAEQEMMLYALLDFMINGREFAIEPVRSKAVQGFHQDSYSCYLILRQAMHSLIENGLIALHPDDKVEDLLPFWTGAVLSLLKENNDDADNMVQTMFLKYGENIDPTLLDTIFTVIDTIADGENWETRWTKLSDAMRERFKTAEAIIDTICVVDTPEEQIVSKQEKNVGGGGGGGSCK